MTGELLRRYRTLHGWAGILCALPLFIAFYAGVLTLFKPALDAWARPVAALPLGDLARSERLVRQWLADPSSAGLTATLHLQPGDAQPYPLTWQQPGDSRLHYAWLDDAGHVQRGLHEPSPVGELVNQLHQSAGLLPGQQDVARYLMGGVCLAYALALFSGLLVHWPALRKTLFVLRPGPNRKRFWLDGHNLLGVFSLPFQAAILLTSLVFIFHKPLYALQDRLLYDGQLARLQASASPLSGLPAQPAGAKPASPQQVVQVLAEQAPGFSPSALQYRDPGQAGALIIVRGHDARYPQRSPAGGLAVIQGVSAALHDVRYVPGHGDAWNSVLNLLFALHFASYGGVWVSLGYCVLALAGAALFYTGNLLWIESRYREQGRQTRQARGMAVVTVGICLGCVAGLSLSLAGARWLYPWDGPGVVGHQLLYYLVVLGALAWACWRGAPRGAVDLLWLSSLSCLLMALPSGLAWLYPEGPWLPVYSLAGRAVDGAALLAALCFALLAVKCRQHMRRHTAEGFWSWGDENNSHPR